MHGGDLEIAREARANTGDHRGTHDQLPHGQALGEGRACIAAGDAAAKP